MNGKRLVLIALALAGSAIAQQQRAEEAPPTLPKSSIAAAEKVLLSTAVGSPVSDVLDYIRSLGVEPEQTRGAYTDPAGTDHVTLMLNPKQSYAYIGFNVVTEEIEKIQIVFYPNGRPQKLNCSHNAASKLKLFGDGSYAVRFKPPSKTD